MYTFEARYYDSKFNKTRKKVIQIEEQFTTDDADAWAKALREATHEHLADGTTVNLPSYMQLISLRFISC